MEYIIETTGTGIRTINQEKKLKDAEIGQ
jgi:hypothetical protein